MENMRVENYGRDDLRKIAAYIAKLPKPTPSTALGTDLRKASVNVSNLKLEEALQILVDQGQAFHHPPSRKTRNAPPCYFAKSPLQYVEDSLLERVHAKPQWTESQLREKVPKAYRGFFDEALGNLITAQKLFQYRQGRSTYLAATRPRPTVFLTAKQRSALEKILAHLNEHREVRLDFEHLLAFLDDGKSAPTQELDRDLREEMLVRWYGEDLPRREGLRSLPILWTWQHYMEWCESRGVRPNGDLLHQLLEGMAAKGHISITAHDSPRDVSEEEAAVLRKDAKGRLNYYWTILS